MDSRDDSSDSPLADDTEPATSTDQPDEEADEIDGFMFNNTLESESDEFNSEHKAKQLADREQERVVDLVRLQPTKNAELQDKWGLDSGSEVHQYLESQLKEYYYRDNEGYIQATHAAEELAKNHQNVYQDVTDPDDNTAAEDAAPDLQQRDLIIALVTLTRELGHLPSADEINEHGDYRHQRYREEFDDLFNAYQSAGILPDDVTRRDFYGEKETRSESEREAKGKKDASEDLVTSAQTEPSDQELLDEIKRLDASLDRLPYESDIDRDSRFTAHTYRDRFESWDKAIEAADIDKEAALLEDMHQVANTVDGDLTQQSMNEYGKYSPSMSARFFGSWSEAKERLEKWEASKPEKTNSVKTNPSSRDVDRPSFDVSTNVDEQDLVSEIQRFADIIDEPPTEDLVVAYGQYPTEEYKNAFGSWDAALETAGLNPEDIPDWNGRSHTNVEVLDGIRAVADELGRAPTTTETGRHMEFSPGLASLRFGSWEDALETASLNPSERSSVQGDGSADSTDAATVDDDETVESDNDGGEDNDPIGSVIDDTLENMLLSDEDDSSV